MIIVRYGAVFCVFVDSNHSHNGNMVKDKHAKALASMVNMKFTDSCIGFAAEEKKCGCLKQFVGEEISPSDSKKYFGSIACDLWNGISDDDDEEIQKEKVIDFLNPYHVVMNKKEIFFQFQVTNEQSSVTEVMQICLPTTCKLLGIPRRIGQAAKAVLLRPEEAATMVLSSVTEKKYRSSIFYRHFSNNLIVPIMSTSPKAKRIVEAVNGQIVILSDASLKAVDDIGLHHLPKKVQSVTFGGTNIIYGFPSGLPPWNGLTKKKQHQALHQQIVDACKFPQMFCKVSYMWSELTADNQPQCVHTDFDPELVEKTVPKPMIGFTSIAKEGMMLLVWTRIPVAADYDPKPKKKKQKKGLPKEDDEAFEHYFLYIPKGILLLIQGNVAHSGGFCFGQNGIKKETNHRLHFYCCPDYATKTDVDRGQNHNLLDGRYRYDKDILTELQSIVLDKI